MCSGDFNEILFNCDKEGGPAKPEAAMANFRQALEDCELHDVGFVGDPYTWWNNHHDVRSYTRERLDRAVANSTWRARFPLARALNGDSRHSDHRPIILDTGNLGSGEWSRPMEVM